jgi:hypothetical protein
MKHPGRLVLAIAITLAVGSLRAWAQVAPSEDRGLSLRVYGALHEKGPLPGPPGSDHAVYGVDVSEVVTRCADGSSVITALVIGGQFTPLNNRCPVEKTRSPAAATPACDANSWNCTISGSPPAN